MPREEEIREALRSVRDPELGYSIVDLGLVYGVTVSPDGVVEVVYTLTSPACPLGEALETDVRQALQPLPGVRDVRLRLTFDPPWTPEKIAAPLKRELRMTGMAV